MDNYTLWKNGEPGLLMEDDEEDDDDNNVVDWAHLYEVGAFVDEPMDEAEENAAEDQPSGFSRCKERKWNCEGVKEVWEDVGGS